MAKFSIVTDKKINALRKNKKPLVEQCRVVKDNIVRQVCVWADTENNVCKIYAFPEAKWRLGPCVMATHIDRVKHSVVKKRVGQQKHKKRK